MRCPYCATANRPNARFCRVCGQTLVADAAEPTAPQTPAAGGGAEATLEMPWPAAERAAPAATAATPAEDGAALSVPSGPAADAPATAEIDPATLEFPTDFAGASALAVQENAAESHTNTAPVPSAAPADQHEAIFAHDPQTSDEAATRATAAAPSTDGEQATAAAVEGRSAAEPPPAGIVPGTSDDSLATPPSATTAALAAAPAATTAADSAPTDPMDPLAALPAEPPAADDGNTELAGDAADKPPSHAAAAATDDTDADPLRDLAAGSSATATSLPLTAETGANTDSPPSTAATTAATLDNAPADESGPATTPSAAADELGTLVNPPAPDEDHSNPFAPPIQQTNPPAASANLPAASANPFAPPIQQTNPQSAIRNPQSASAPLPPFGEPETMADPPDSSAPPPNAVAAELPSAAVGSLSADAATSHLREDDAPATAPPVPGEAFPALQPGALVAGRYTITQVVQTGPQRQTYLATDGQGYLRCWACGSRENVQGELYCTNCGAQLTGRSYRLFETPPGTPAGEIAPPLLENLHSGVAGIFDNLTDPANGRHYLVLEDVGGKSLALALVPPPGSSDHPPTPDHLLTWIGAATQTLAELHAARIVGCDFTPQALGVLPDDRLVLVDPSACRMAGTVGDERSPAAEQQADVQRVAAILEQWLTSNNTPPGATGDTAGGRQSAVGSRQLAVGAENAESPTQHSALRSVAIPQSAFRIPHSEQTIETILARGREGAYKTAAELAAVIHDLRAADQPPADLQLISGRATDVGAQRKLNEDSLFALETVTIETGRSAPTALYIVADGMGGHESGEIASSIAVRTIPAMLNSILDARMHGDNGTPDQATLDEAVREAILEANRRIAELGRQRQSDMGTTVTMALVLGNSVTVANVGDSRTYLWRDGKLHQISEDHSLVARLIAAGQLTAEEGRHFERRNEIYRALGDGHLTPADVDVFHAHLRPLDALVLCSDGLWEMVRDADIEQIMLDAPDPPAATQALIVAANRAGGEDNITVIIAQTLTSSEDADA